MKNIAMVAVLVGLLSVFSNAQDISDVIVPKSVFAALYENPPVTVQTEEYEIGSRKDKFAVSVLVGWRDDRPQRVYAARVASFMLDFNTVARLESEIADFLAAIETASRNPNFSSLSFSSREGFSVNHFRASPRSKDVRWTYIEFGVYKTYSKDTRHLREILTKLTNVRLKMTELGAR